MKKYLDYVPSWLDGATTLLDKINICIARVEQSVVTEETLQDVKELKEKVETLASYDVSLSSKISKNTSDIAKNTSDIAKNTSDIAKNTSDIAKNTSDIAKNTSDITKKQDTLTAQTLEPFVEGSDTVVVDLNESGDKINIHLENDVINDIASSLKLPDNKPNATMIPVIVPVGKQGTQSFEYQYNITNRGVYYRHELFFSTSSPLSLPCEVVIYSTYNIKFNLSLLPTVLVGHICTVLDYENDTREYCFIENASFANETIKVTMYKLTTGEKIENVLFYSLIDDNVTTITWD